MADLLLVVKPHLRGSKTKGFVQAMEMEIGVGPPSLNRPRADSADGPVVEPQVVVEGAVKSDIRTNCHGFKVGRSASSPNNKILAAGHRKQHQ